MVPQLEVVGAANSTSLTPNDAPSLQATKLVGELFEEYDSNSSAMIVLESDKPLGAEAHQYYDGLIADLEKDKTHIQHIQDLWSDPLTSSGSQSADNLSAYVQLYIAGNQGETLANESVAGGARHRRRPSATTGVEGLRHRRGTAELRPAARG